MMISNYGLYAQGGALPKINQRVAGALAELVPMYEQQIGGELVQTVNGRELHGFLESKQHFSDWIKDRINDYQLIEGIDFVTIKTKGTPLALHKDVETKRRGGTRGWWQTDYFLSIVVAKELSMVERNEQGRQARRYFIDCERRLAIASPEQLALAQAHWQESRVDSKDYHKLMCQSLQQARAAEGKETKGHHYSNELTMLNRLLLGMDGKSWLAANGITGEVRQHLNASQLALLSYLESSNATLIDAGFQFAERKLRLTTMLAARIQREAKV